MEHYGVREEIKGLHCRLHSDYVLRRESFLVTSAVHILFYEVSVSYWFSGGECLKLLRLPDK